MTGLFDSTVRDAARLLPRYVVDNIFMSRKFNTRFPNFRPMTYREGLALIEREQRA
ncbi:hypothetical protein [Novosphingobium sp. BL-52-GroH]|uniref:hypothetical protein n=1 Tax=Novosphingobium sp. BL-52-GroH TaxID=3349877 RepID=UPI00384EBF7D